VDQARCCYDLQALTALPTLNSCYYRGAADLPIATPRSNFAARATAFTKERPAEENRPSLLRSADLGSLLSVSVVVLRNYHHGYYFFSAVGLGASMSCRVGCPPTIDSSFNLTQAN
jgi:hypothetical protein